MYAEQGLSPKRKKTKSIVSSPSPLFYAKSRLKLTQRYALTASSNGTQVVLYLKRVQETGRRVKDISEDFRVYLCKNSVNANGIFDSKSKIKTFYSNYFLL
ncbi:hypothetical protein ALC56_02281 [Trachymyrmex septentrionalis]|uniref:Uncharacterized protein n=1 Tax=Trachymyrmex septentrionalis TaxID=34720 RepID=A0A195FS94_9HYME|nr:hypothetical protein ALC56_02281 [Trachymyrmex septentrionalis]